MKTLPILSTSLALLASLWLPAGLAADPYPGFPRLDRHVERPDAQAGQPNSLSSLQRSVLLPAAGSRMKFSYEVDSAPGDELRVYAGGQLLWQLGGRLQRGRAEVWICPGAGVCTVSFEYRKNGFGDGGRDTAFVDDVSFLSGGETIEDFLFDEASPGVPAGWSSSGWGGWEARSSSPPRSAIRPPSQAFLGGGSGATTSWMERTFSWPSADGNFLDFTYFVDSADGDLLRVSIDGVAAFEAAGAARSGRELLPVTQGSHAVRFEYAKSGIGEEGLDTARVTEVAAHSGGEVVEVHDFRGQPLDSPSADWQAGGYGGGWVVTDTLPSRSYVPEQTVGQKLAGGWKVFDEPIFDGWIAGDYENATELRLFNYGDAAALPARIAFVASASETLFVAWRAPAVTTGLGDEAGKVTLYVDGDRDRSLRDLACQGARHFAGEEGRLFTFEYQSGSGEGAPGIVSWSQEAGTCTGTFEPLDRQEPWRLDVEVREPVKDVGWVHFELRLSPPAGQGFAPVLGIGLVHETVGASVPSLLRFPFRDGAGPSPDDVHSWETVVLELPSGEAPGSDAPGDGVCCYPEPGLPGVLQ